MIAAYSPDGDTFGPFDGRFSYWHILTLVVGGLVWLIVIALLLAVLFFLIRFLIVATRAAQLYVHQHSPAQTPEQPVVAREPEPSTTVTTTPAAATKPTRPPRTPRTPPAAPPAV